MAGLRSRGVPDLAARLRRWSADRPSRPGWLIPSSNSISITVAALPLMLLAACGGDEPVTDPRPISVESPFRYPIELWDEAVEGEVVLMVHVTAEGAVDSAYVLESSGEPALDSAAVQGARDLGFAPGRRGERRIDMWAKLPVRFQKPEEPQPGGGE